MTTRTPRARKAPQPVAPQQIPADLMCMGFVAVLIRFPQPATAHRVARVTLHRDDAPPEVVWTGDAPIRHELRAACQRDADAAERVYELSASMAHHHGATACPEAACFGRPAA